MPSASASARCKPSGRVASHQTIASSTTSNKANRAKARNSHRARFTVARGAALGASMVAGVSLSPVMSERRRQVQVNARTGERAVAWRVHRLRKV